MRIVGLTGGIGSGKSTLARVFRVLGIPVFDSDQEARELYALPEVRREVGAIAGDDVFDQGHLLRGELARRVFTDPELLTRLNAIIHPRVQLRWTAWLTNQEAPYVVRETAILFESLTYLDCARIITISAPESLRIHRVMHRDGMSEEEVRRRMARQWTDPEREALATEVWINDDRHLLLPGLLQFHDQLIRL